MWMHLLQDPEKEDYEVVEGSQFVIKRQVYRQGGGSTSFFINGRRCMQKDIINLLKSKGLNILNNRFLILQGEVEQIAMMKPKANVFNAAAAAPRAADYAAAAYATAAAVYAAAAAYAAAACAAAACAASAAYADAAAHADAADAAAAAVIYPWAAAASLNAAVCYCCCCS